MERKNKTVLVTGATGQSGGAAARHLLANGWQVRALTRDASKPAARALRDIGVEVFHGDFSDEVSLIKALNGVYGVYSVQLPHDIALEIEYGKRMANLAKSAGVKHIVYSSVGGAERNTGIPHFESKRRIEEHIEAIKIPHTILRPVYFMENLYWKKQDILNGRFTSIGLDKNKPLQMIAVDNIGAFARLAFENPTKFLGQAIEIAGDELTEFEIAEEIGQALHHSIEVVPANGPPPSTDIALMNAWFNEQGYEANIDQLRVILPELTNFKTWLKSSRLLA